MNKQNGLLLVLFALCGLCLCCITPENLTIWEHSLSNTLLVNTLGQGATAILLAVICLLIGQKFLFSHPSAKALLWCSPCLMVALANFPFHALLTGSARIVHTEYVGLFVLSCFAVACVEELLFRGILLQDFIQRSPDRLLLPILLESSLFSLAHLLHLFAGAGFGATLLQVGYTFLIGIMLSFVTLRTKNILPAVFLHTLFNIGGQIVPTLGQGRFQDGVFWAATVICGLGCALHILYFLYTQKTSQASLPPNKKT